MDSETRVLMNTKTKHFRLTLEGWRPRTARAPRPAGGRASWASATGGWSSRHWGANQRWLLWSRDLLSSNNSLPWVQVDPGRGHAQVHQQGVTARPVLDRVVIVSNLRGDCVLAMYCLLWDDIAIILIENILSDGGDRLLGTPDAGAGRQQQQPRHGGGRHGGGGDQCNAMSTLKTRPHSSSKPRGLDWTRQFQLTWVRVWRAKVGNIG